MSNILKISTPMSGYENNVSKQNLQMQEGAGIKNPVNPDKVIRADRRTEYGEQQGVRQGAHYDSNFGNFVRTLTGASKTSEIMTKMLFSRMANLVEAGIGSGTADEIQGFLKMLEMEPEKLKNFLKNQVNGSNRLKGSLFDMLRSIMKSTQSVELKAGILDFLKKYNDLSSGKHLLENIKGELRDIEGYMFRNDREILRELSAKLLPHNAENAEKNIQTLKEEIIPFLGKYISDTKNTGKIRDIINLLAFNTSRYENGDLDKVAQAFKRLGDFSAFRKFFPSMGIDEIRDLFENIDFDRAAGREAWADKFLDILEMGAKGNAGIENREDFMTLIHGMLINESVYMPLLHVMLPVILNGTPIYSEIWLNPDEPSEENEGSSGVKMLLKFDMKDVGFFDVFCYYENGNMDMIFRYPDSLADHEKEIREGIEGILKKNGMKIRYLAIEKGKEPIQVSAAFPQIYERRNTINVTI